MYRNPKYGYEDRTLPYARRQEIFRCRYRQLIATGPAFGKPYDLTLGGLFAAGG